MLHLSSLSHTCRTSATRFSKFSDFFILAKDTLPVSYAHRSSSACIGTTLYTLIAAKIPRIFQYSRSSFEAYHQTHSKTASVAKHIFLDSFVPSFILPLLSPNLCAGPDQNSYDTRHVIDNNICRLPELHLCLTIITRVLKVDQIRTSTTCSSPDTSRQHLLTELRAISPSGYSRSIGPWAASRHKSILIDLVITVFLIMQLR